jgi:predicted ATP-binding protein involved in virulence
MQLKSIRLENVGQFTDLTIPFAPTTDKKFNNTIIIGNNGAGKSTILESIATALSWYVARIRSEKGNGTPILELKIKNDCASAAITVNAESLSELTSWVITKAKKGKKLEKGTRLDDLNKIANLYRHNFTSDPLLSFPLMVFYDANRGVLDMPLKIRGKHTFEQLDGYDNALRGMVDYRRFFEWYREREDFENEQKIKFFAQLNYIEIKDLHEKLKSFSDPQLKAVREALEVFLPEFKNLRVERKPRLHMAVDKNGSSLNIEQLSQGEKLVMAMVGDIARRMAIMNPTFKNPLLGTGIILIDEAELHLHPRWQRILLRRLTKTFPHCQFIITTHSPLLISDYKDVLCYSLDNGVLTTMDELYGLDVNQVLLGSMDTEIRSSEIDDLIDEFLDNVQRKDIKNAKKILEKLENDLPENHFEIVKARLLLRKMELQK